MHEPLFLQLLNEIGDVFSKTLGNYTGEPISLPIDPINRSNLNKGKKCPVSHETKN